MGKSLHLLLYADDVLLYVSTHWDRVKGVPVIEGLYSKAIMDHEIQGLSDAVLAVLQMLNQMVVVKKEAEPKGKALELRSMCPNFTL